MGFDIIVKNHNIIIRFIKIKLVTLISINYTPIHTLSNGLTNSRGLVGIQIQLEALPSEVPSTPERSNRSPLQRTGIFRGNPEIGRGD